MNNFKVITLNVNPASATVGSLHPEACIKRMRRKADIEGATLARRKSGGLLRAFFGPTAVSRGRSAAILALRLLFGAAMIANGIMQLGSQLILALFSIVIGSLLAIGIFTRSAMTAGALCFAILSGMAIETGSFPLTYILIAVMCIGMAMAGPGHISFDALMRRGIFRSIRRYETNKLMQRRFSYRAYHYAHIN